MNFVGHIAVALQAGSSVSEGDGDVIGATGAVPNGRVGPTGPPDAAGEVGLLLGTALPDLAAMGRFRLLDRPADAHLARGVDLHHRTDDLFHGHRWFRTNSSAVADGLEGAGLPRGAARACGHVGVELLLDGHLLASRSQLRPKASVAVEGAGRRVDELEPLVQPGDRALWRRHLERVSAWPVPEDYHDPRAVAERLQRILSRRPRLAFDQHQIVVVADLLAARQAQLVEGAADLMDDLAHSIGGGEPPR